MSIVRFAAFALACALASTGPAFAGAGRGEQTERPTRAIAIVVNGETLDTETPPQVLSGRALVPMREVFEALGLSIDRDGARVFSRLPTGQLDLYIGSSYAQLNGKRLALGAQVAELSGAVFVPLQLLASVFGAQTAFDQRAAKIEIVSPYVGRQTGASTERSGGGSEVQGVLSALDADSSPPSLTIVRAGTSRTISINSDAKIWTTDVTIHSQIKANLVDLRVGDAIHAILARDGRVISVFDFYRSTGGTIVAVSGTSLVMENGHVVTPSSNTDITLNDQAAHLSDLKPGDYLTVRSNPESGELRQLVASRAVAQASPTPQPGTPPPAVIDSVALSVIRPLRAGESFDVTLKGTPGGQATFDIGDLLLDRPMKETSAGTYVGRFTIPDRFNVREVPVYGKLNVGPSTAPRLQAPQTLSAATTPPIIGEVEPSAGQTVNNARPSIFATYSAPTDIPINQSSVTIEVNGHDVTSAAVRTATFVTYSPGVDLPSGPITVVVKVSDAAGNSWSKSWTFTIAK